MDEKKTADSQLRKPKVKFFLPLSTSVHKGTCFGTKHVYKRPAMFQGYFTYAGRASKQYTFHERIHTVPPLKTSLSSNRLPSVGRFFLALLIILGYFHPNLGPWRCIMLFKFTWNMYRFYFSLIYTFSRIINRIRLNLVCSSDQVLYMTMAHIFGRFLTFSTTFLFEHRKQLQVGGLKYTS